MSTRHKLDVFWFLPTSGDGRNLGTAAGSRPVDFRYMREIAMAVDRLGFGGVLLPTGQQCEDGWTYASAIAPFTERLRFLVALRPGVLSPTLAARQAVALDRITNGRLILNIVTGGNPLDLAGDGLLLDHDARYRQTAEFLTIWRGMFGDGPVVFTGEYLSSKGGRLHFLPVQRPHPELWFGGSSEAGIEVAAKHVDLYLTWAEPPSDIAAKIEIVRARAAVHGRRLRFGIRLHLIVRETDYQAWDAADALIRDLVDETIATARSRMTDGSDSEGQRRQIALHQWRRDRLEVSPNLWAGIGLVRNGAGTALVGSPETVAKRLREYQELGIETVIASGYPHLEEAYRVAELLFPALGLANDASVVPGGEFGLGPVLEAAQ